MKLSHIAISLMALAPVPALAQQGAPSVVVSYADLDLHSEAGVKVLDRRLAHAIRSVCGEQDGSAIAGQRFAAQRCVKEKQAQATALRDGAIASYAARLASR